MWWKLTCMSCYSSFYICRLQSLIKLEIKFLWYINDMTYLMLYVIMKWIVNILSQSLKNVHQGRFW